MSGQFSRVGSLNPRKNKFSLTGGRKFTTDMGELNIVFCRQAVPGDVFNIACQTVVRAQPMRSPILHEITVDTHYFFLPHRLLWKDYEKYISGGKDGNYVGVLPKWNPTVDDLKIGTLWDQMGFPITNYTIPPLNYRGLPMDAPRRAYNFIWDEYYRDENLDDPINTGDDGEAETPPTVWGDNRKVLKRRWKKDYFTSSLPFRQRGDAPALPITGTTKAVFNGAIESLANTSVGTNMYIRGISGFPLSQVTSGSTAVSADDIRSWFNNNTVDLSVASTFDVNDLRQVVQLQKWMERNARSGVRYTSFLRAHFNVSPSDSRLNRPEYIGGNKSTVMVDEIVQTSESDGSPQGTMVGHGLSANEGYVGKYRVEEYGIIMGIQSIMPTPVYEDGIDREWLWTDKEDWYFMEFAHLGEQAILNMEVFPTGVGDPDLNTGDFGVFGYQGRYDELRVGRDIVCGEMRSKVPAGSASLSYWHLARSFTGLPNLNSDFIECNPDKRIFAVTGAKGFIVNHANIVTSIRPLPEVAEPGLIDHF